MDTQGHQITPLDRFLWLLIPYYKKAHAQWQPHEDITVTLLLGHLYYSQTKLDPPIDPLRKCKPHETETLKKGFGLLTLKEYRWNWVWKELFKQEPPFIFDIEKTIEYHIRYLEHLIKTYGNLDLALRVWIAGEEIVDYLLSKNVCWERGDSIEVLMMAYYLKSEKKAIKPAQNDMISALYSYPGFVRKNDRGMQKRLEKYEIFKQLHYETLSREIPTEHRFDAELCRQHMD